MGEAEVQAQFRRFVAPLAGYAATSPDRKELAEMMARALWAALIAGPEMEDKTWEVLRTTGNLDDEALQPIQQMYFEQMKPVVSPEQLAVLRERYRVRRKE